MNRLPVVGGDDDTWGNILNGFLEVSHNSDGTLTSSALSTGGAELTTNKGQAGGYAGLDSNGIVPSSQLPASSGGMSTYRAFTFNFNTANILTGAALYTPTVGDLLLDAWIEITTAWDGTSPKATIGAMQNGDTGWNYAAWDMTLADTLTSSGNMRWNASISNSAPMPFTWNTYLNDPGGMPRLMPAHILQDYPICICVSQTGYVGGSDPSSTQGEAILYLVTATPTST